MFIEPNGLWEFNTQKDKDSNTTNVQIVAQKGDTWKTFKKQTGLSKKDLKQMFGDEYQDVLGKCAKSGTIEMEDIGGSQGEMLQEMENALVNLNNEELGENNCLGAAVQVTSV